MAFTSVHRTHRTTVTTGVTLKAPGLRRVVDVLLAAHADPEDRRARIQRALLEKEGLLRCPCCQDRLDVAGYEETRSRAEVRRALRCGGCRTVFVVDEQHRA